LLSKLEDSGNKMILFRNKLIEKIEEKQKFEEISEKLSKIEISEQNTENTEKSIDFYVKMKTKKLAKKSEPKVLKVLSFEESMDLMKKQNKSQFFEREFNESQVNEHFSED